MRVCQCKKCPINIVHQGDIIISSVGNNIGSFSARCSTFDKIRDSEWCEEIRDRIMKYGQLLT